MYGMFSAKCVLQYVRYVVYDDIFVVYDVRIVMREV